MRRLAREKSTRVGFKILRNLSVSNECVSLMIDNGFIDLVAFEQKKPISDEKLRENIVFLVEVIEKGYKIFSSFERFQRELESGKLSFGPCHCAKFWKENFKKAEVDDFKPIKQLIHLLDSEDAITKAVACFDLGEFSRLYPYSKLIVERINGKAKLISLVENSNEEVREQALVALQKLMIHNLNITS